MDEDDYLILGVVGLLVIIPIVCILGSLIHNYLFKERQIEETVRYQEII